MGASSPSVLFLQDRLLLQNRYKLLRMALECLKRFIADVVFDAAGIVGGNFGINTERSEQGGDHAVAFINFICDFHAGFGQSQRTITRHQDIAALFEQTDGTTDTRFGNAHVLADIHGTDNAALL